MPHKHRRLSLAVIGEARMGEFDPGSKKATIAVGHTLLVIVYHVLADEKDYQELGGNYFDEWDRQAVQKRSVRRLLSK
jgi:hypothetical protein